MLFHAILAFIAFSCIINTSEGCMCMPMHPQEQLCGENTFAALVKVRSMEYVYMMERPKNKVESNNDKEDMNKFSKDKIVEEKYKFDSSEYKMEGVKRHHVVPFEETERVEVIVKDLDQLSQKHFVASHIRYRVKVYETYKGMKAEEVLGKKLYIYTAPDEGLCGITLNTKEMYLIIGDIDGDRLTVGLCDHVITWNSLDSKQKRSIRKNMRATKQICASQCEVQTCTWSNCPKSDENTCMWTADMERSNTKLSIHPANYMCTPQYGEQGEKNCGWTNALSSSKRRRRRRRHHASAESYLRHDIYLQSP